MLERIEEWRTKPVQQKRRYGLVAAATVTLVIAGIWASTIPSRLAVLDFDQSQSAATIAADTPEVAPVPGIVPPTEPSRFAQFAATVGDGFAIVKNKLITHKEAPAPLEPEATTTPMAWTDVVEAQRAPIVVPEGDPIMILVATTTASTSKTATTTSSGDVIQ